MEMHNGRTQRTLTLQKVSNHQKSGKICFFCGVPNGYSKNIAVVDYYNNDPLL